MDFERRLLPVPETAVFTRPGYFVWGASMLRGRDGKYYVYYSYWEREKGFDAWVTDSRIGIAVADTPTGTLTPVCDALAPTCDMSRWDASCYHNPTVHCYDGRYYLCYMANRGDGSYWNNRNNQRIGIAWSDDPLGPWHPSDKPIIDVTEGAVDALMTSNPSLTRDGMGLYHMLYKAVAREFPLPVGGPVICSSAEEVSPLGPYRKSGKRIMDMGSQWSVEDPYLWYEDGRFYALVKDFSGHFAGGERNHTALFEGSTVETLQPCAQPHAFGHDLASVNGTLHFARVERPQLYLASDYGDENDILLVACATEQGGGETCNIRLPLAKKD